MSNTLYSCRGKGGTYEYIGLVKGAGTKRQAEHLEVYRDLETGLLYYRTVGDFKDRMVIVDADTSKLYTRGVQAIAMTEVVARAGKTENIGEALFDAGFRKVNDDDR